MSQARLTLRVQPGTKRNEVAGLVQGVLRVRVTAQAREGKANEAVVELLARVLEVPKGRTHILLGHTSRDKTIAVDGLGKEEALRRLLPA